MSSGPKRTRSQQAAEAKRQAAMERDMAFRNSVEAISVLLSQGKSAEAERVMSDLYRGARAKQLPADFLIQLAQCYSREKKWKAVERVLQQTGSRFPNFKRIPIILCRAQAALGQECPRKAIRMLESIDDCYLSSEFAAAYTGITKSAQKLIVDGCIEVE